MSSGVISDPPSCLLMSVLRGYSCLYSNDDVNSWQNFAAKFGRGTMAIRVLDQLPSKLASGQGAPSRKAVDDAHGTASDMIPTVRYATRPAPRQQPLQSQGMSGGENSWRGQGYIKPVVGRKGCGHHTFALPLMSQTSCPVLPVSTRSSTISKPFPVPPLSPCGNLLEPAASCRPIFGVSRSGQRLIYSRQRK